jgi:hypothetical protein
MPDEDSVGAALHLCRRGGGQWRLVVGAAASGRLVGPRGAHAIPLDLEGAGGQRFFPGLLQDTAAAHSTGKVSWIRMA